MSQIQSSEPAMDDPSTENQGFRLSWAEDDEVDLSTMQAGGSLHVSDLKLPAGVVATHAKENPTIATAAIPRGAKGDDAAAAAAPAEEAKK
jgi:hypothetical protein